jgi:hypothetical protein
MQLETFSVREAGYVTDLPYASVNRMIDSRRVPRGLLARGQRGRMLTAAGVLFVAIEKEAEGGFTGTLRKKLRQRLRKDLRSLDSSAAAGHAEISAEFGGLRAVVELGTVRKGIGERRRR